MALSKVVPGQKITAVLFNELIDGVNGGSNSAGNGNTSILQNSTSFIQYPPDWVNNYGEDLLHSWTPDNEWFKLGALSIKDPLVVVNNDVYVAELDEDCSESLYNNIGDWYCGVRKDLLGESLDDSDIEEHPQRIIYTNNKSGKTDVYIFQDVFNIFYHQTPTSPCIYTFRNVPPTFYSYSGGSESGKQGYPALFDYEETTESETYLDESGSEHERMATNHYVVRNIFYYNDQEESLPDYKVLDKDSIVYLHVQYPLDAESKPDKTHKPTFFINETGATTGDYAYRLWELDNWNVKCDCRTALVPLYNPWDESESESERDALVVAKGPFEPIYQNNDNTKKVTGLRNCVFQWERRFLDMGVQTLALPQSECWILLEITHPTTPQGGDVWPVNYRIRFETVNPFNNQNGLLLNTDDTITLIPLYKLSVNGTVLEDYRAVPVAPVYR